MNEEQERAKQRTSNKELPLSRDTFIATVKGAGMTYEPSQHDLSAIAGPLDETLTAELPPPIAKFADGTADVCRKYLAYPIIADAIEQHNERRGFRNETIQQLGKKFSWLYEENRIKGQTLSVVHNWLKILAEQLDTIQTPSPKLQKLRATLSELPDISGYHDMTLDEKRAAVARVDSTALAFLRLVTLPHE